MGTDTRVFRQCRVCAGGRVSWPMLPGQRADGGAQLGSGSFGWGNTYVRRECVSFHCGHCICPSVPPSTFKVDV